MANAQKIEFCPVECEQGPIFNCLAISPDDAVNYYREIMGFTNVLPLAVFETEQGEVHHITPKAEALILEHAGRRKQNG